MLKRLLEKFDRVADQALRVGVALLLTAIPLYPKFPIINIPNTYVAVRLEDFLITFVLLIWILRYRLKILRFFSYRIFRSIGFFWLAGFLSLLSALLITQTILPHIGFLHALRRIEYMVVFFVMFTSIKSKEDVRFYVEVILLTGFLVFIYAAGQKFLHWPIISTMNQEYSKGLALNVISGGRINSTFAGHYDLAAYTVLMLNFEVAILMAVKNWRFRLWIILVTISTFWMLLMSASRISFAAYLGSITLTLWFLRKRLWIVPVLAISVLLSSLAPSLFNRYADVLRYEFAPRFASLDFWSTDNGTPIANAPTLTPTPTPKVKTHKGGVGNGAVVVGPTATPTPTLGPRQPRYVGEASAIPEDRSTAIRFKVEWPRALRAFSKNPLLGTGYSSITLATDNDYFRLLGEVGALGLLAFGLIFAVIFVEVKKVVFSKPKKFDDFLIIGIVGGSIGLLSNAVFIDVFEASKIATFYWLLLALMFGAIYLKKGKKTMKDTIK